jgi:hypothetical protein
MGHEGAFRAVEVFFLGELSTLGLGVCGLVGAEEEPPFIRTHARRARRTIHDAAPGRGRGQAAKVEEPGAASWPGGHGGEAPRIFGSLSRGVRIFFLPSLAAASLRAAHRIASCRRPR